MCNALSVLRLAATTPRQRPTLQSTKTSANLKSALSTASRHRSPPEREFQGVPTQPPTDHMSRPLSEQQHHPANSGECPWAAADPSRRSSEQVRALVSCRLMAVSEHCGKTPQSATRAQISALPQHREYEIPVSSSTRLALTVGFRSDLETP